MCVIFSGDNVQILRYFQSDKVMQGLLISSITAFAFVNMHGRWGKINTYHNMGKKYFLSWLNNELNWTRNLLI